MKARDATNVQYTCAIRATTFGHAMLKRFFPQSDLKRRKKIDLMVLIELILDFALITGFLAAVGFLISMNTRLVF